MNYVLLAVVVLGLTLQQVASKIYGDKVKGGAYSFTLGTILIALLFFVITMKNKFVFSTEYVGYSVAFGVATCMTLVFTLLALQEGPLSLSTLVTQYSLLIPTAYGLLARGEKITWTLLCGVAFLLVSLIFINFEKEGETKKINLKWILYISLAFVGNGACSTIQAAQQHACNEQFKNEFMIIAYAMSVLVLAIFVIVFERKHCLQDLKKGALCAVLRGIGLAVVNFLVMYLTNRMEVSVMFPIISAGGTLATFLVAVFVYKEKLSKFQNLGFVLGIISVIFLNI